MWKCWEREREIKGKLKAQPHFDLVKASQNPYSTLIPPHTEKRRGEEIKREVFGIVFKCYIYTQDYKTIKRQENVSANNERKMRIKDFSTL